MVNYYKELGINQELKGDALKEELKKIQRKWIQRTNAPDQKRRQEAELKVTYVDDALKILLDEKEREKYDKELSNTANKFEKQEEIDVTGKNVEEAIQYAWSLISQGRYPDAIMVARSAISLDSQNAEAWATLAYADYMWGNVNEAINEYKKAISIQPTNDSYYSDLGNIYLDCENMSEAEDYARKAMHINPNSDYNKSLMATVLYNKGKVEDALIMLEEVVANNPQNENNKKLLALCYYQKGLSMCHFKDNYYYCVDKDNTESMIEYMKKAKELDSDPEFDEKINWGEDNLKKTFDTSKFAMYFYPGLCILSGQVLVIILGLAIAAAMIYFSIRPKYELTRRELLGKKNWFDYIGGGLHFIVAFGFIFAFGMIKEMLSDK